MKRTVEVEMEVRSTVEKAIARFFKKHPELDYWRETFEYMAENNQHFFSDETLANGERNKDWAYALHLDVNGNYVYMCVIERA